MALYSRNDFIYVYISIFLRESLSFSDDTQIRTTEEQEDFKQTVYLLDHVTLIFMVFSQIKLRNKYQVSIFHEDHFFFR